MNWPAWLCLALGVGCALYSLRIGEEGVARYGRRLAVTEMIPAGRRGDRRMLLGGLSGFAMAAFFALAGWLALTA